MDDINHNDEIVRAMMTPRASFLGKDADNVVRLRVQGRQ